MILLGCVGYGADRHRRRHRPRRRGPYANGERGIQTCAAGVHQAGRALSFTHRQPNPGSASFMDLTKRTDDHKRVPVDTAHNSGSAHVM
jgi:hypothetical protein